MKNLTQIDGEMYLDFRVRDDDKELTPKGEGQEFTAGIFTTSTTSMVSFGASLVSWASGQGGQQCAWVQGQTRKKKIRVPQHKFCVTGCGGEVRVGLTWRVRKYVKQCRSHQRTRLLSLGLPNKQQALAVLEAMRK